MSIILPQYKQKPRLGAQVNWSHPLSRGIVAAFLFNEGGGNSPKNVAFCGDDLVVLGGTPTYGISEQGRRYAGTNDGDISTIARYGLLNYTWMIRFNADAIPGSANNRQLIRQEVAGDSWGFSWSHTNATFRQAAFHQSSGAVYTAAKLTSSLSALTWYTIVGTYDGTNLKCWLNGRVEATTASNAPSTTARKLVLNRQSPAVCEPGYLSFAYVWSRALSAGDIQWLTAEPYILIKPPIYRKYFFVQSTPSTFGGYLSPTGWF